MSGAIIEICPPRNFDFTHVAAPGSGTNTLSIPVAERLEVTPWTEGALVVRVHSINIYDPNDSIELVVSPDGSTEEDPSVLFIGTAVATRTLTNSDLAPSFLLTSLTVPFGSMVRVDVRANRSSASTSTASLLAKLSAELVLKAAGPSGR